MPKHNITTKKITEFTVQNTIYIRDNKDDRKLVYLCNFINYNKEKRVVTGIIIEENEGIFNHAVGRQISAGLSSCALYGNVGNEQPHYRWFDNSLYAVHPLEETKIDEHGVHVEKHPSYGLIQFSRRSHNGASLFGSSIQSRETVSLTISRAKHKRDLADDWYYSENEIIEVEMSQIQFAELITSFNRGEGIPCTIRHVDFERYPEPPFQSKADIFHSEFQNKMHNFSVDIQKNMEQAIDILKNKNNIGKGDRDVILKGLESLMQELSSNIPFVAEQFTESMQHTVLEAKGEIEAFIENKIRTTGLEALGFKKEDHTPLIDNNQNTGNEQR
jgi:hypothetical protein